MRTTIDGLHAMAVRHCEAASTMTKLSSDLLARPGNAGSIEDYTRAGQEFGKHAVETALSNAFALTEIAAKMQRDTLTILGDAASETLGDLCALMQNGIERP